MALSRPKSMAELDYFTQRSIDSGHVKVWVFKGETTANIIYTCPKCSHKAEKQVPFKRKKVGIIIGGKRKQVEALQFECDSCERKINVTKKLK